MRQRTLLSSWTRRRFLSALGLATGAAALQTAGPLTRKAEAGTVPFASEPVRIGLLLPRSGARTDLPRNLVAGLRLGFAQAGVTADLAAEEIGFGASGVGDRFNGLIHDGAEVVVAATSAAVAAGLRPLIEQSCTCVIVADAGAHAPRTTELSTYIYYSSLGYWQSNWALGRWAATHLGNKGFLAASFYESGYDSLHAFRLGVEAGGGQVVRTQVTQVTPEPENWTALFETIRRTAPDFVGALYSGRDAAEFLSAYQASGLAGQIPLVGSAFLVDEPLLQEFGPAALSIRSSLPWAPSLQTPANEAFTSPRGPVAINPATHALSTPLYLRQVVRGGTRYLNAVTDRLDPISERAAELTALRSSDRTGWLNGYLNV